MSGTTINEATLSTPVSTDRVPLQRSNDSTARSATVSSLLTDGGAVIGNSTSETAAAFTGKVSIEADVAPETGAEAALLVTANALDESGSQWAAQFNRVYTMSGETTPAQLDGLLTALYHDEGHTLALWKGIETGGGYIDGSGSVVTAFYGLDANIPTVTNGGGVVTAAAIHIASKATTGMTTAYALWSELVATSLFMGKVEIQDVSVAFEASRSGGATTVEATAYANSATAGARFRTQFARGTRTVPTTYAANDILGRYEAYGYADGAMREVGAIAFYGAGTPGVGSYGAQILFRIVPDASTTLTTRAILAEDGSFTVGSVSKTTASGNLHAAQANFGVNSASFGGQVHVISGDAARIGLVVAGDTSATADVLELRKGTTAKFRVDPEGIIDFRGTMGNSTKNPESDTEADWIEVKIGGTPYYIPVYAAS